MCVCARARACVYPCHPLRTEGCKTGFEQHQSCCRMLMCSTSNLLKRHETAHAVARGGFHRFAASLIFLCLGTNEIGARAWDCERNMVVPQFFFGPRVWGNCHVRYPCASLVPRPIPTHAPTRISREGCVVPCSIVPHLCLVPCHAPPQLQSVSHALPSPVPRHWGLVPFLYPCASLVSRSSLDGIYHGSG